MSKQSVKTIADIARLAGVSKSTVSRALNDSSLIGTETKDRIRALAKQYKFQLNAPAAAFEHAGKPHDRFCDPCLPQGIFRGRPLWT